MSFIDRQMAKEIAEKWRKEHPEEAKKLDEIFKDEAKLKAWLEAKGFHLLSEERFFIVEQADDGTLFLPEWFKDVKKARKRAKEDSKGLRTEGHSILLCEVLATHEKEASG